MLWVSAQDSISKSVELWLRLRVRENQGPKDTASAHLQARRRGIAHFRLDDLQIGPLRQSSCPSSSVAAHGVTDVTETKSHDRRKMAAFGERTRAS